ncbi:hypothetical protein [Acinetobacter sp.]|jgi:hypothetical protein|uniref:hypothetical protein n=1 Tax=Acinetobacter sp. TaxID=472 RepID=UPI00282EF599|nr:hypothetical protein [Acinetobacter sp.]MDR0238156.1 hypothetical protein [Acinetobacter sp.]
MTYLYLAVKAWREILIGLLAFLLLICLALLNHKTGQIEKYKQTEIILQAENAKAKADSALKEKQWSKQQLKAEQNYNAKIKQIQSDADLANASANSMSKKLKIANSRLPSASKETNNEYCATLGNVFERSIEEYSKMARHADEHRANEEKLIEAWPSE